MPHEVSNGTLTADRLRYVLDYDRETGVFRWKNRITRTDLIGQIAGCDHPQGYRVIRVDGFLYKASRLAWLYVTGRWPESLLDHADGRRNNDAFANLREATSQQNNSNKRYIASASGFKGVYRTKRNTYIARLVAKRRCIYFGTFGTALEAAIAYNAGAVANFGKFARLNQV